MKPIHISLGLLVAAATAAPACKHDDTDTAAPADGCALLRSASARARKWALERFDGRPSRLHTLEEGMKIAAHLEREHAATCGRTANPSSETVTAPSDVKRNKLVYVPDERELSACLLRDPSCLALSADLQGHIDAVKQETRQWRSSQSEKILHGSDDRRSYFQLSDAEKAAAQATVAIFEGSGWSLAGDRWRLNGARTLRTRLRPLCEDENFKDEPSAAVCSGAIVGDRWVATARHCIDRGFADLRIVTHYGMSSGPLVATQPLEFPAGDVYRVARIADRSDKGEDWALLELDRPIGGALRPLEVDSVAVHGSRGLELAAVGYPIGLPVKYAGGARVIDVASLANNPLIFYASLDTYGGNSGSPVIDTATNLMVGILIRGDNDWTFDAVKRCFGSRVCHPSECTGEVVQRVHAGSAFALALARLKATSPFTPAVLPAERPRSAGKGK